MNKKLIITIVVVAGIVLLGIKGKSLLEKRKEEVANQPLPSSMPMSIELAKPTQGVLQKKVSFLGQLLAQRSIKLSTKLAGYVEKVIVKEAQEVKQGDLLVEIDAVELRSSIEALQTAIEAQKSDLNLAYSIYLRNQKLYKKGGLSKEKMESSKVVYEMKRSIVKNSEEKLAQLKHQLEYLHIKAPFDGVVDTVFLHEGDLAATGKPILAMSNYRRKLLFSYAPEVMRDSFVGKPVFWEDKKIGEVSALYPASQNGLAVAEVSLEKTLHYPLGANITVDLLAQEATGCILPSDTLLHKKEGIFVMVYKEDRFVPMKVNVIMEDRDRVMVSPCPDSAVAKGSEARLSALGAYDKVTIVGEVDAQ